MSLPVSLHAAVRRKWTTPAQKEWWYQKFATARRRKLLRLSEQQNHHCCYCQCLTWMVDGVAPSSLSEYQADRLPGMSAGAMATLEHIVALSKGGTEHDSNLIMSCYRCNSLRGNHVSAMEFWEMLHDPSRYQAFITRRRLWGRRVKSPAKVAKQQIRRDQLVLWLAYLCVISPAAAAAFTEWMIWIDQQLVSEIAYIDGRMHDYVEAT